MPIPTLTPHNLEHAVSGFTGLANMKGGDAVSTGLGLGLGLALTNYMFQATKPSEKTAKPLIVCLKCQGGNALENKFCWHCGSALYPPSVAQCSKCKAAVPAMTYCGNCGSQLKK